VDEIIIGFVAVACACILLLELATQLRMRILSDKLDALLKK